MGELWRSALLAFFRLSLCAISYRPYLEASLSLNSWSRISRYAFLNCNCSRRDVSDFLFYYWISKVLGLVVISAYIHLLQILDDSYWLKGTDGFRPEFIAKYSASYITYLRVYKFGPVLGVLYLFREDKWSLGVSIFIPKFSIPGFTIMLLAHFAAKLSFILASPTKE